MPPAKRLSHTILLHMVLLVAAAIGMVGYLWVSQEYSRFNAQSEVLRANQIESRKADLKNQVHNIVDYISFKRSQTEDRLRANIMSRTNEAHSVATHIYEMYSDKKEIVELQLMIREALHAVRFDNGKGYYFAYSMDGIDQFYDEKSKIKDSNWLYKQDSRGAYVIRDIIALVREKGEGFHSYYWPKPDFPGKDFKKISFIKYFAPLDWFIGTGAYVDDMEEEIKEEVLQRIEKISSVGQDRVFAGQWDGLCLTGENKGKNMLEADDGEKAGLVTSFIDQANAAGGYVMNIPSQGNSQSAPLQINYVEGIVDWEWYVGACRFMDDVELGIENSRQEMLAHVKINTTRMLLLLASLLVISFLVAQRISRKIKNSFDQFTNFFQKSVSQSEEINRNFLKFDEFQQLADSANRMVAERKSIFHELIEKEKRYRALFDSSNDAVFFIENEIIIDCNKNAVLLLDTSREMIVGRSPLDFLPAKQPGGISSEQKFKENNEDALAGKSLFLEWTICRYDGTPFEAQVWMNSLDVSGHTYLQVIVKDVTEQKKSESQLIRLALAIEQAAEEIIITDQKGLIQYVNPAFEQITGYSCDEVVNKTDSLLRVHEDDAAYDELWTTVQSGEVWRGRINSKKKNGLSFEEDATVSPVVAKDGSPIGYVFVKRDVTEQVKIESMFRQSQKMEAIGSLAGGIAHDFNNILAAIFGFTEIAKLTAPKDSPVMNSLEKILQASRRARDLVKQILAFSRQTDSAPQMIQVKLIVNEAIKLLKASLPSTIVICQNLQSDDVVLADPTSIHQIVMNLCTNASHAMRKKGGRLDVSLLCVDLDQDFARLHPEIVPGQFLKLSVADTGHGIAPEIRERIFDPFFTSKEEGEGTGMGLSVVHGIVKNLGGTITFYSEPGVGSTFNVFLPVQAANFAEEKKEYKPLPTGTERILFVDDEEFIVEIGQQMLELLGYKVIGKTDSFEALSYFKDHPDSVDLVITDYTMPRLTGTELVKEIRKIRSDLPVLLCTGYNVGLEEEGLKDARITDLVFKPVVRKELAEIVRRVLDKEK